MAKATKKTEHCILTKKVPTSPQKHMLKTMLSHTPQPFYSTLNEAITGGGPYQRAGKLQGISEEHQGQINKIRGEHIDQLQTQAASLMRLNAAWGLESKGPQIDRLRASVNPDEADQGGVFTNVFDGMQQMPIDQQQTMSDLDAMIHFYLQQPEDTGFFIYLIPGDSGDPYDLVPLVDYRKENKGKHSEEFLVKYAQNNSSRPKNLHADKFFTMSKKGFTTYLNDEPIEFISLQDWYNDRNYYRQISSKDFFRNFRKWKIIRMWRRNIVQAKRKEIQSILQEKLFLIDPVFGEILLSHRKSCKEIENQLRVIDMKQSGIEIQELSGFLEKQREKRHVVTDVIKAKSKECRDRFEKGINKTLDNLRQKETEPEDEASKTDFKGETQQPKQIVNTNPTLEALGFKHSLKYGPRSNLRKACSKFLRFSYLLDFLATEALTNIYLLSVEETIEKLQQLSNISVNNAFKSQKSIYEEPAPVLKASADKLADKDKIKRESTGAARNRLVANEYPFFEVTGKFVERPIPEHYKYTVYVDYYNPPPLGDSSKDDFNPLVHLEIDDNNSFNEEVEDNYGMKEEDQVNDSNLFRHPATFVKNLCGLWLKAEPDGEIFAMEINKCLLDGMECLKVFMRWSRHPDLDKYEAILEDWDDRVCIEWEPPDQLYLNCDEWLISNKLYETHSYEIKKLISFAFKKVEEFFTVYDGFLTEHWQNLMIDFSILDNENLKNPSEVIEALLYRFKTQKNKFEDLLPESKDVGMIKVNTLQIREKLLPVPKRCLDTLKKELPRIVKERIQKQQHWLQEQINAISKDPQGVGAYVRQIQCMENIDINFQKVKDTIQLNSSIFELCVNAEIIGKDEQGGKREIATAYQLQSKLSHELSEAREQADKRKEDMKKKIQKKVPKLTAQTILFTEEITKPEYLDENSSIEVMIEQIERNEIECSELVKKMKNVRDYQETLDMKVNQFESVDSAYQAHQIRKLLWFSLKEWTELVQKWQNVVFDDIDVEEITALSDEYFVKVTKCESRLPGSSAVMKLSQDVRNFKSTMPIVTALGNKKLQAYHWHEIKEVLNMNGDSSFDLEAKQFTLGELIGFEVGDKQEEVVHISTTATQEFFLRAELDKIIDIWNKCEFTVVKHKEGPQNIFKLKDWDSIINIIDESLSSISDIQGSRYVKRLQEEVEKEHNQLITIADTIEQWKIFQRNWLYLGNIFDSSKEIKEKCNKEYKDFDNVDKFWIRLMKKVNTQRQVKRHCIIQRLEEFTMHNKKMEEIQKKVEEYLDEKRTEFPRLYFISNDELLQLLSQHNIEGVEPQLNKLFDQLYRFEPSNDSSTDLFGMKSQDGEVVEFIKHVKINAQKGVEGWLKDIESAMIETVKRKIKEADTELKKDNTVRSEWVLKHCGQAVAVASMLDWTEQLEIAIQEMVEDPFALGTLQNATFDNLIQLVELIRGADLKQVHRKSLTALITHEVHNRDIVEELTNLGVESIEEFAWKKCLRYYLYKDDSSKTDYNKNPVIVCQVNASLNYCFEYMGVTSRLVITPLTDRCWLTITGALHIKLGASPKGPAGTGKTESTKDLAKGLGIFCLVFNCSEQIEYRVMTRIFSGVVQSGVWTCLDEFNRINVEVMSVIAQQLGDIRQAKLVGKDMCFLNNKEMKINANCGVFITMNPGYQGRAELPDNLKVLFRAVSMMIPAYGLVAQVMLFSEGFDGAENLATKMVQLYKLSSEQLSQNDHYDFGMRAVKSVLVTAGNLKRANPELPEDVVLIRAMRDSNVPKFVAEDLPLFNALIQDLFPGVQIPQENSTELESQIIQSLNVMNLKVMPTFVTKVTQLFDTFNVRFGVMIVGPAGGGKTTIYKTLAHAMTKLRKRGSTDQRFQEVKVKCLNPKSISMDELYGIENADDGAWTDGLGSKIIRKMAKEESQRRHWCVFDGPVDAIWIENMNTVLDDNCTLCLSNGERVKLRSEMRMLFEVQDLAVASPATVSRCGMVYMTPSELGWRPYKTQWMNKFILQKGKKRDARENESKAVEVGPICVPAVIQELEEMFELYVDEAMRVLELYQESQAMTCVNIQMVINLCSFLECFIVKYLPILQKDDKDIWQRPLGSFFAFSFYWAFGGHFKVSAIRFLDNMMRNFFAKHQIPTLDTVYEYVIDPQQQFKFVHYKSKLQAFEYPTEPTPFFQLVVPTVETKKVTTLLQMMTSVNKPIFVTGSTGTGKSMIVQKFIQDLRDNDKAPIKAIELNFSAQTDSKGTQAKIEGELQKKRKRVWGVTGNAKFLIFIDDVNMPMKEIWGAQPPIELLRQLIDQNGFYDRQTFAWKEIERFTIVCAAAPPSGGRAPLTPRFMRHFQIVNVPEATEETLTMIFDQILGGFFTSKKASEKLKASVAVQATIDIYIQVQRTMLPIPAKFHYTFNLRDVAKVFQGILMCEPFKIQEEDKYGKLWLHECTRVFADRLTSEQDMTEFQRIALENLITKFKVKASKPEDVFGPGKEIIFSNILTLESETQYYELIDSKVKLLQCLNEKLSNYNLSASSKMDLVFFDDAVTHICAIMRILMQKRGNAMLIGVSGSGKQSLTHLAAFILDQISFQVKLSKNFDPSKFREQIKERMLVAGTEESATTFILNDTQIMYESFLEDINNILNTGDITGLYETADITRMEECLTSSLIKKKIPVNKANVKQQYIESLRDNFHIILCMSPVGELLRVRSRMFPSLINCCTLDWFNSWPYEALVSVANQFLRRIPRDELSDKQKEALSEMFPIVHKSVESAADKFHIEMRRKTYVTPKSFLDGINLYLSNLKEVQENYKAQVRRLTTGILNLRKTTEQIKDLEVRLISLRPKLDEKTQNAQEKEEKITRQKLEAQEQEKTTEAEAANVEYEAIHINLIKQQAESELENAKPALEAAERIVNGLQKSHIDELKKTMNPNEGVALALQCIMIYLGSKKADWPTIQKAMAKADFLDRLKRYEKDNIPQDILVAVNKLMSNRKVWSIAAIKNSSMAAGQLAEWCAALYKYSEALKKVRPKQARVEEMTLKYNTSVAEVNVKKEIVRSIKEKLKNMEEDLNETRTFIDKLQNEKEICERRLENAKDLLRLLGDEGERWEQTVVELEKEQVYFKGNVFLAAASLSYMGPFTGNYREELIKDWQVECEKRKLEISPTYSLVSTLGNQIQMRDWQLKDLPSDSVSLDNAILAQKSSRWPLMIDPQTQANKWLKKMLRNRVTQTGNDTAFGFSNFDGNDYIVINATTPEEDGKDDGEGASKKKNTSQKKFEYAIQNGITVLFEEAGETLDPGLDPILTKSIYIQDGVNKINFGGKAEGLIYDENFRLLITTKLSNPHFLPETCIKLTIINFTVTFPGLEEQLLVDVMKSQEPEIEQQKDTLTVSISNSKNQLYSLQSKILQDLANANPDTILDNNALIDNLEVSKSRSQNIKEDLAEAEQIEVVINKTRNFYRPVAERGSILYFSITDMSGINQMYQNSLQYVKKLFNEAISSVKKVKSSDNEDIQKKLLQGLVDSITRQLYEKICIGLFEQHKVVYAFIICTSIQRKLGLIQPALWNFLLKGAGIFDKTEIPEKPNILTTVTQDSWDLLYILSKSTYTIKPLKEKETEKSVSIESLANDSKIESSKDMSVSIEEQKNQSSKITPRASASKSKKQKVDEQRENPFKDICHRIIENQDDFADYIGRETEQGFFYQMPLDLSKKLTNFEKIIFVKCLKPEKVLFGIQKYLELDLGQEYAISPISSMENLFRASTPNNPIIFVLSQGVDPMQQVRNYAERENMGSRLKIMSLGSGQGAQANRIVVQGQIDGDWVFLQNCHLYKSWMPQLEILVSMIVENQEINPNFRLILTSMPVDYFPQSILQSGLKMTTEPPRGIKANLQRSYSNIVTSETYNELIAHEAASRISIDGISEQDVDMNASQNVGKGMESPSPTASMNNSRLRGKNFPDNRSTTTPISEIQNMSEKQQAWRNLLFGLCFFHAVIQERRKFGPLGWNIIYEFSDSDLIASITMLKNFLLENDEIPWDALKFMTGSINYGGNVTDDFDRILLLNILNIFQNDDIVNMPNYKFSQKGTYFVPVHDKVAQIQMHIEKMPNQDDPEIFGMHSNANIAYLRSESKKVLETVLNVQPREQASSTGDSPEKIIIDLITMLQSQVPEIISKSSFAKEIMKVNNQGLLHCLSTVLLQEVHRYTTLLQEINSSLTQLHDAVLGKINMSATLDAMHTELLNNRVPKNWSNVSYLSLKPLSSWMTDLTMRMQFMQKWATSGHPTCFWLAGFFFPHGFITGVLQTFARKQMFPIDLLHFEFDVLASMDASSIHKGPSDGVYIFGLFIENAKWNAVDRCLQEPAPGEMQSQIPVIHFIPKYRPPKNLKDGVGKELKLKRSTLDDEEDDEIYKCPVYKTSARAGVLSTTGQSTNFILTVNLPCGVPDTEEIKLKRAAGVELSERSVDSGIIQRMSAEFWTLRGAAMLTMLNS